MYTHQAGADGSTAPLTSRKKFSLFLGPPSYVASYPIPLSSSTVVDVKDIQDTDRPRATTTYDILILSQS